MARPEPQILIGNQTEVLTEILAAERIFAVTYQNRLIGLRVTEETVEHTPKRKYKKTMYNNLGSAALQARRLNLLFNTTDFNYVEITQQYKL